MRRNLVRAFGFLVVALLVAGAALSAAQDKPAQDKEKKETVAAADDLSGDWDGTTETPNGTISFTLKIVLDKDKVTGEIASSEGGAPVSGTWTDGKLSATFDYNGTPMTMTGTLKEGVLSGEMNFGGGQAIMPWSAKKHAK